MGKTIKTVVDAAEPVVPEMIQADSTPTEEKQQPLYSVFRDRFRVSDAVYPSANDEYALRELNFWRGIVKRWPDGTKVNIYPIRSNGSAIRPERKKRKPENKN
jgi:hypothetical protein